VKTRILRKIGRTLCYFLALSLAGIIGYLFFFFPDTAIPLARKNLELIVAAIGVFIGGPVWAGYSRLSAFDKFVELPPEHKARVTKFASAARVELMRPTVKIALVIVGMIIILAIGTEIPHAKVVFSVTIPLIYLYIIYRISKTTSVLIFVEKMIAETQEVAQKEVARKKLIESLRDRRISSPLVPDEHLIKYRDVINAL
jgi:hypothetical protein